jgi:hypothetical protein
MATNTLKNKMFTCVKTKFGGNDMATKTIWPVRIFRFYLEGFKSMDWGRTLWAIILIKLFIMFVVLRIFFFPRYLNQFDTHTEQVEYVSSELINRAITE